MVNEEIRQAIAQNRLRYYEVASACGISPCTLSVWLRNELLPERRERILKAINEAAERIGM